MVKGTKRKTNFQTTDNQNLSEEELIKKLKKTLFTFVLIIFGLYVALGFFGPKVGAIFLLFSKNRNDSGPGDIVPPSIPIFSQVPEAVKDKKLTLNGGTEPGATVVVYLNGPEKQRTTADNNGNFTFADLELSEGNNIIFAKATDSNNNESGKSREYLVIFDEKKPQIKILEPKDGETIRNLNERVFVKGELNEAAEVKVNGRSALTKSDNTFEILLGVEKGDVKITIEATDKAGNKTTETINVRYEKTS